MGAKELFRRLEIEAHRPAKAHALDAFLPKPEAWPSQIEAANEKEYKVDDKDMAGMEMESSVSLEELLDRKIPDAVPSAAKAAAEAEDDDSGLMDQDELDQMGLGGGGSVRLDELLGEEAPTRPSKPKKAPVNPELDADMFAAQPDADSKDMSLDDILDQLVPEDDAPKPKKKGR